MSTESSLKYTPVSEIPAIVAETRAAFDADKLYEVEKRKTVIRALARLVKENRDAIEAAVQQDVGRCPSETRIMETVSFLNECYFMLDHIDAYSRPVRPAQEGLNRVVNDVMYHREPLGVVLVLATWNYPALMILSPVLAALSGGNTVVVKPSEISPHTAALMTELIPKYVTDGTIRVVNGGPDEATALLAERFDHIMYTGSTAVGKIVMAAAAKHVTPVTLELGGKSPTIIDETCAGNMEQVLARIVWGKYVNAGQTCIAPDYLLVHESQADAVVAAFKAVRERFQLCEADKPTVHVRENVLDDPNYGRIVNQRHYERVAGMLSQGEVVVGGETDAARLKIGLTLLRNPDLTSPLMTDEIFGPLMPMATYKTQEEAVNFVRSREKPLALYVFSSNKQFIDLLNRRTASGVLLVNDVMLHVIKETVPFGGVGNSGLGSYHWNFSYETFTHLKPVVREDFRVDSVKSLSRFPPYSERQSWWYSKMAERKGESGSCAVM